MSSSRANGFMEFRNPRGEVQRLLVPFRAVGDYIGDNKGYSRFDLFGYHPKQHQGLMEATWEAWRLWQLRGFQPQAGQITHFEGYREGVQNVAAVPGRGRQNWLADDTGRAVVKFEGTVKGNFHDLDTGIKQGIGNEFITAHVYEESVKKWLEHLANEEFPANHEPNRNLWPARFWHHLMYAFCIEATNIVPIYRRLILVANSSEQFAFFHEPSQRWMRTTESLWRLTLGSSDIVNDGAGLARRNAYYRLFGLDLGKMLDKDMPFDRPEIANTQFVPVFEDLLYEVWNAYMNRINSSGPNTTDPVAILEICRTLRDMLNDRRVFGTLTRAEYSAVVEMSWYYFAIDGVGSQPDANSPIITDMRVNATTPDERLRRLGDAVGVAAHPKTRSLLKLAERTSLLLIEIEEGRYSENQDQVKRLYEGGPVTEDMLEIINEWSILVGRDLKAARTAPQRELPGGPNTPPLLGR